MAVPVRTGSESWSLDDIDRGIIAALQTDGRKPFSKLAQDLDISESGVRYRMRRLEEAGVLQVVGIANPLRIGFDVMALVGLNVAAGAMDDVCAQLSRLPETSYVAGTAGAFDVFVEVICRDTAHFSELLTARLRGIQGVTGSQSFFVLDIHKMAYGWGVGARPADRPLVD
jgi:Lrp/AsnC family transcriptional regulator for asnA, asnC and gidA